MVVEQTIHPDAKMTTGSAIADCSKVFKTCKQYNIKQRFHGGSTNHRITLTVSNGDIMVNSQMVN